MSYDIDQHAALIVVDPQIDFFEGGALGIKGSSAILSVIQMYVDRFSKHHTPIFVTRDWHPAGHVSFNTHGGPWPPHGVQHTPGAMWHPALRFPPEAIIISKGTRQDADAYSGFEKTYLHIELQSLGTRRVFVCGLATDYCVKHTVLDACALDYEVFLLEDAIKGVDLHPWDSRNALSDMAGAGAKRALLGDFR